MQEWDGGVILRDVEIDHEDDIVVGGGRCLERIGIFGVMIQRLELQMWYSLSIYRIINNDVHNEWSFKVRTSLAKFVALMRSNLFAEFDSQVVGRRRLETWGCLALGDADSKEDGENCFQQHDSILILID